MTFDTSWLQTLPLLRWILSARRRSRERRRATTRGAMKTQIVHLLERAAGASATGVVYVAEATIGQALRLSVSELQPLLEELVTEGRVFRGIPPHTYTNSSWRPDPRRLYR